jgi:hypothetical protein
LLTVGFDGDLSAFSCTDSRTLFGEYISSSGQFYALIKVFPFQLSRARRGRGRGRILTGAKVESQNVFFFGSGQELLAAVGIVDKELLLTDHL